MHEMGIASSIYRIAQESIAAEGGGRLCEVRVAVGELTAVEPDLLRFAWQALTAEFEEAEPQLIVEFERAEKVCPDCGPIDEVMQDAWFRLCPRCSAPLTVNGGNRLDVVQVGFEPLETDAPST